MKKILMVLCVLAICVTGYGEEKKVDEQGKPEKEKPDYRSVIVEAWLLRVDANAIQKSGVQPLSEKENGTVTLKNLAWCLSEPNSMNMITSARIQTASKEQTETRSEKKEYIKEEFKNGFKFTPYSSRTSFKGLPEILDDKHIRMEYSFYSDNFFTTEPNVPAGENDISFANIIKIPIKKPIISGQVQIGNYMFFLIMRSDIVE
ncbi:MAG: hypothetical protein ABFD79_04605 [Phycisphaerales bacterium]